MELYAVGVFLAMGTYYGSLEDTETDPILIVVLVSLLSWMAVGFTLGRIAKILYNKSLTNKGR